LPSISGSHTNLDVGRLRQEPAEKLECLRRRRHSRVDVVFDHNIRVDRPTAVETNMLKGNDNGVSCGGSSFAQ
jgi:hypothetical protein